jgi:predicted RNA methylase
VTTRYARLSAKLAKFYGLQQRLFDLYYGTSTGGAVPATLEAWDLSSGGFPYQGSQWPAVSQALAELRPNDSEVFVDFGAGKGKALVMAGRLPYRRVVGVEMDSELAGIARRNIARVQPRLRAGLVECEIASALDWEFPDDASTVFMYNPFFGPTFRGALTRVFDSYDRNPRRLHIVYQYPLEHNWLIASGRVVVDNVRSIRYPAPRRWWQDEDEKVIVTYHVTHPAGPDVTPAPHALRAAQSGPPGDCLARALAADSPAMRRWSSPVESLMARAPAH